MGTALNCVFLIVGILLRRSLCDFSCVCNYNEEKDVLGAPDLHANTVGTMYEFDCKPSYRPEGTNITGYMAVHFENKIGYVQVDDQIQDQLCPGLPSPDDLVTTKQPPTISTVTSTIVYTSRRPTTSSLASTTRVPPTSQSTLPSSSSSPSTRTVTQLHSSISTLVSETTSSATSPKTSRTTSPSPTTTVTTTSQSPSPTTTVTTTSQSPSTTPTVTTKLPSTSQIPTTQASLPDVMNVSGTPLQYVGIGYNLLHGNPDGNPYGTTHLDEGFKLDKRILQMTHGNQGETIEAEYTPSLTQCSPTTHDVIVFDELSYQKQMMEVVTPSSTHPSELLQKAFTLSIEFKHLYPANMSSMSVYRDITTGCARGHVRYNTEEVNNGTFSVTKEFASAVCQLPQTYNIVAYLKFLEAWGTSIVISSDLGLRTTTRYQITQLQAFDHVQKMAPELIQHSGPYLGYSESLSIDVDNFTITPSTLTGVFGTLHSTIRVGGPDNYVPIHTQLVPITYALDPKLWTKMMGSDDFSRMCPSWFDLSRVSNYVDDALRTYASAMSAPTAHSVPLRIPVTWPTGQYGLMKASTGCPAGHVSWLEGWRKQDTEDHDAANHFSPNIYNYIDGQFDYNNVVSRYCIKKNVTVSVYDRPWPPGQYCLLQYNICPTGFTRGFLSWDDEDEHNKNTYGGTMPTGNFDKNTRIYYCCRTDGAVSTPIYLPTDSPFLLLRYGPSCQSVYHTTTTDVYIRWDDEDEHNHDARGGTHPYDDGGDKDHRLHFCHYKSASQDNSILSSLVG